MHSAPADGIYSCTRGGSALVLSIPHSGRRVPGPIAARMTAATRELPDTDWRVDELHDFALGLGATVVRANYNRYVVDLNRPPDGAPLYPGQAATGLCPATRFDGGAVYAPGREPDDAEIERRRMKYWQPYHDRLEAELERVRGQHGKAVLYDCHSIAPVVPRLFAGRLPALNLGTNRGRSCARALQERVVAVLAGSGYEFAVNGRFIGGFITRRYGQPGRDLHALQMEIAQDTYMDGAAPETYSRSRAARLRSSLRQILEVVLEWADSLQSANSNIRGVT